jgi:hypothetical protein
LLKEVETADEYVKKFKSISMEIESKVNIRENDTVSTVSSSENSYRRKFKLPTKEFRKFGWIWHS